jgi:hypothetical protein
MGSQVQEDIVQLEIQLRLPGSVAREAEQDGLLLAESIEVLLREELRRRRVNRLFESADRLADLDGAPLTEAEVEAEIKAARRSRRASNAGRR